MTIKAVVTGHSRGLGAAIAQELSKRGIAVLAISRQQSTMLAAGGSGANLREVSLDLSDPDALAAWLSSGALRHFAQDCETLLVINNAGTVQPVGPLGGQDPATVGKAVCLNVAAPLMIAAAAAAACPPEGELRIVHVSSGAARSAYAGWSAYCATKAALDHHARAVAMEGRPNLRICSLAPGVIDTDMQAEVRSVPEARFPMREKFLGLKREGLLSAPEDCARRLVAYVLGASFGLEAVADLRAVER